MTLTLAWNNGQNVAMFQPGTKLIIGIMAVFVLGILFLGLLGLAVLAGVGFALWNIGVVVLHLVMALIATDLLIQGLALLILVFVLLWLIVFFLRYIWASLRKPVQAAQP